MAMNKRKFVHSPGVLLSPRRKRGAGSIPRSKAGLSVNAVHASEIAMTRNDVEECPFRMCILLAEALPRVSVDRMCHVKVGA